MQILLLSGGSGKRLWPLSNNSRSKQFIKLLNSPDGQKESMVQRVIRQLGESDLKGHVTVATSLSQADVIYNQLGEYIDVVVEPERRDTFPAIALAASADRCTSLKKICTFFGIYIDIKMRLFALSTIDVSKEAR